MSLWDQMYKKLSDSLKTVSGCPTVQQFSSDTNTPQESTGSHKRKGSVPQESFTPEDKSKIRTHTVFPTDRL